MIKWFENINISKKLSTGFLSVVVLCVIVGLVGVISLVNISNNQQVTYNTCTLGIKYSSQIEIDVMDLRATVRDLCLYYDTDKDTYLDEISSLKETVLTDIEKYGESMSDGEDQANYDAMKKAYENYETSVEKLEEAAKTNISSDDFIALFKAQKGSAQEALDSVGVVTEYNSALAVKDLTRDKATSRLTIFLMIGVVIVTAVISLLLRKVITDTIAPPVQKFAAFAELLAVGDVEVGRIIEEKDKLLKFRKDEIGTLAGSFNKIIAGTITLSDEMSSVASGDLTTDITIRSDKDVLGIALTKLVGDFNTLNSSIISAAEQVDAGAKQVANSSISLSQGSTEQASSVQELSASIAEVSQHIKANAEDAEKAKDLSAKSEAIMQLSTTDMELTRNAMDEISATSKNISKVIKAIDDIAFQTNILALNAAVEAARAGAAGKGFAVVADEVRNLSQKSAEAAKSTTVLIESSISAVEKGTELVSRTSSSFTELALQAAEVNKLVEQISAKAQDQAAAIAQISVGIDQVSAVVQMNSATSEESAAASEELSSQANYLKESTERFKIKG
ncbi:MAG: MCP four helix bundle domain-containing protein [Oscillospiraceae bacterium]|nr:MCP four helix bundle domain-containing protein [Oscillospiraceae bacterium]